MLEFGLVWQGVVLAAAAERGLLDREELAGEFLAPLSSPQGLQGPERKGLSHKKERISFSVADPGSGAFLTPGSEMGKKSGSGSGMNNRTIFPRA